MVLMDPYRRFPQGFPQLSRMIAPIKKVKKAPKKSTKAKTAAKDAAMAKLGWRSTA